MKTMTKKTGGKILALSVLISLFSGTGLFPAAFGAQLTAAVDRAMTPRAAYETTGALTYADSRGTAGGAFEYLPGTPSNFKNLGQALAAVVKQKPDDSSTTVSIDKPLWMDKPRARLLIEPEAVRLVEGFYMHYFWRGLAKDPDSGGVGGIHQHCKENIFEVHAKNFNGVPPKRVFIQYYKNNAYGQYELKLVRGKLGDVSTWKGEADGYNFVWNDFPGPLDNFIVGCEANNDVYWDDNYGAGYDSDSGAVGGGVGLGGISKGINDKIEGIIFTSMRNPADWEVGLATLVGDQLDNYRIQKTYLATHSGNETRYAETGSQSKKITTYNEISIWRFSHPYPFVQPMTFLVYCKNKKTGQIYLDTNFRQLYHLRPLPPLDQI